MKKNQVQTFNFTYFDLFPKSFHLEQMVEVKASKWLKLS